MLLNQIASHSPQTSSPFSWFKDNLAVTAALAGVLIGGFLTAVVWPFVRSGIEQFVLGFQSRFYRKNAAKIYLDSIIDQHRYLPILPSTLVPVTNEAQTAELDDLYINLSITDNAGVVSDTKFEHALRLFPRLIVLGDPGSGKTTMLRYLALTLARARRGQSFQKSRTGASVQKAKVLQARKRVETEYGLVRRPIPIFLYLNRLRDVAEWPHGRSLLDYLDDEWKTTRSDGERVGRSLRQYFEKGECIFLFDAFDELASDAARFRVGQLISALCSQAPDGNRFVLTSRIIGYKGQLNQSGFKVVTVQELSWPLVTALVSKWYAALGRPELSERLLYAFMTNPGLLDLAENPMLLSLIALVQYVLPLIPDRRHVLYDECLKVLIERRYASPAVQAEYNKVLPAEDAMAVLRALARLMHEAKLREITREALLQEFLPEILARMPLTRAAALTPKDVIDNIEERSQLLVERGINDAGKPVIAFSHLTFQEYLASSSFHAAMSSIGKTKVVETIVRFHSRDPEWWQEVLLLFAAQLERGDQREFLEALKGKG